VRVLELELEPVLELLQLAQESQPELELTLGQQVLRHYQNHFQ
jgi:hypothetical protein